MNYVTPTNYLELVQGYMKMLKVRHPRGFRLMTEIGAHVESEMYESSWASSCMSIDDESNGKSMSEDKQKELGAAADKLRNGLSLLGVTKSRLFT